MAYLRFDKVLAKVNNRFNNMTFTVGTTSDQEAGVVNYEIMFFEEIIREQHRIKLSIKLQKEDEQYSQVMLSTSLDYCKLLTGVQGSFFSKILLKFHLKDNLANYSCPMPKYFHLKFTNSVFTDEFLPPTLGEKGFRVVDNVFGIVKGLKGWKNLYSYELTGRARK